VTANKLNGFKTENFEKKKSIYIIYIYIKHDCKMKTQKGRFQKILTLVGELGEIIAKSQKTEYIISASRTQCSFKNLHGFKATYYYYFCC